MKLALEYAHGVNQLYDALREQPGDEHMKRRRRSGVLLFQAPQAFSRDAVHTTRLVGDHCRGPAPTEVERHLAHRSPTTHGLEPHGRAAACLDPRGELAGFDKEQGIRW